MPVDHASSSSWEDEPSELPVAIGDVLDGKYKVVRVLGKGGMGVVMSAEHVELGHRIALKFLSRAGAKNAETLARFALEAKAAALMRSEHATRILDIGRLSSGAPYMVLEFLEGMDLGALVKRRGPLPIAESVTYVLEACEAIAEAHSLGIVHRDLKPDNLFLATRPDGTKIVKVLDFGISKFSSPFDDQLGSVPALTTTSAIIGSPIYMSPEQLKSTRDVDYRTDIWSLGVALYELIAGQPPFPWRNMAELSAAILKDAPVPLKTRLANVPPELDRIILRCLEKNPDYRPANIAELAWALAPFGKPEAMHSAERASELLARAPKRALKFSNAELEQRQALETQSDQTSAVSRKIIAVPAGVSRPAAASASTKELMALTDSLTGPILRGLPIAAIFAVLLLVIISNRHLRSSFESTTNVSEAKRGIAQTMAWMMATKTLEPKIEPAPAPAEKKALPNASHSAQAPGTNAAPSPLPSGRMKRDMPKSNSTPAPAPVKRRNPYADRE